jgi:hypothetical protein
VDGFRSIARLGFFLSFFLSITLESDDDCCLSTSADLECRMPTRKEQFCRQTQSDRIVVRSCITTVFHQARMAKGIHGLPKVSPGPAMLDPSTPCGRPTPEMALMPFRGWPAGKRGGLRPSSTPLETPRRTGLFFNPQWFEMCQKLDSSWIVTFFKTWIAFPGRRQVQPLDASAADKKNPVNIRFSGNIFENFVSLSPFHGKSFIFEPLCIWFYNHVI